MKSSATTLLTLCAFYRHHTAYAFVPTASNAKLSSGGATLHAYRKTRYTYGNDAMQDRQMAAAATSTREQPRTLETRTLEKQQTSNKPMMDFPPAPGTGGQLTRSASQTRRVECVHDIWDAAHPSRIRHVQGDNSLQTWSFENVERAQVMLRSEGRPLDASVELWAGPDHSPQKMRVYSEDGGMRPFSAAIMMPWGGYSSTVAVRNTGHMSFPLDAMADADNQETGLAALTGPLLPPEHSTRIVQGGSLYVHHCDPNVERVQVFLETDGRPLNARIELMEGPNTVKQLVELDNDDGTAFPFLTVLETPAHGCLVRIINTGPMEFPIYAAVHPIGYSSSSRDGRFGHNDYNDYRGANGGRSEWYDNDRMVRSGYGHDGYNNGNGRTDLYRRSSSGDRAGYGGYERNNRRYGDSYYNGSYQTGSYGGIRSREAGHGYPSRDVGYGSQTGRYGGGSWGSGSYANGNMVGGGSNQRSRSGYDRVGLSSAAVSFRDLHESVEARKFGYGSNRDVNGSSRSRNDGGTRSNNWPGSYGSLNGIRGSNDWEMTKWGGRGQASYRYTNGNRSSSRGYARNNMGAGYPHVSQNWNGSGSYRERNNWSEESSSSTPGLTSSSHKAQDIDNGKKWHEKDWRDSGYGGGMLV